MKSYPRIISVAVVACLFAFSCKKDKNLHEERTITGKWQLQAMAEDWNNNEQMDADEIKEWVGDIWVFNADLTGYETATYKDTSDNIVTRTIPFMWVMLNDNKDIMIHEIPAAGVKYLSPHIYIHSLSSTRLITKSTNPFDGKMTAHWEIYSRL